jgi:hypothetical protein
MHLVRLLLKYPARNQLNTLMTMQTSTLFADKSDLYATAHPKNPSALFGFISDLANNSDETWDCATGNSQEAVRLAKKFKVKFYLATEIVSPAISHLLM